MAPPQPPQPDVDPRFLHTPWDALAAMAVLPRWIAIVIALLGTFAVVAGLVWLVTWQISREWPSVQQRTVEAAKLKPSGANIETIEKPHDIYMIMRSMISLLILACHIFFDMLMPYRKCS